jgi:hypothetical protein
MKISRAAQVYGAGNPLPVGKSKFWADYVLRSEDDVYIPGTSVKRLRPIALGPKARGFDDDEINAVISGLRAERRRVVAP